MSRPKRLLKYLMSALFVLAGVYHFVNPDVYLRIMPPYFPWHLFLVYLTGAFEIILGVLLAVSKFTRIAGLGLIVLLIVIFPANIHMAINAELYPHINPILLWIRLPLQGVLAAWAYWYTRHDNAGVSLATSAKHK